MVLLTPPIQLLPSSIKQLLTVPLLSSSMSSTILSMLGLCPNKSSTSLAVKDSGVLGSLRIYKNVFLHYTSLLLCTNQLQLFII